MSKFFRKILKNFDSSGRALILNINGKEKIRSYISGSFSLANYLFFTAIFLWNIHYFIWVRNPIVVISSRFRNDDEIYDKIEPTELLVSTFFFAMGIGKPKGIQITPNETKDNSIKIEYAANGTELPLSPFSIMSLQHCENITYYMEDEYFNKSFKNLEEKGSDYLQCLKLNESLNVGGDPNTDKLAYLSKLVVNYDLCEFLEKEKNCTIINPTDTNKLKNIIFFTMIKNHFADYNNDRGISSFMESYRYQPDFINEDYLITLYARKIITNTDNNLIYSFFENRVEEDFIFKVVQTSTIKNGSSNSFTVTYQVKFDYYVDNMERTYLKIDGMLANVSSIAIIIDYFSIWVGTFFSEGNIEHAIYKEIFHIKNSKNKHEYREFIQVNFNKFNFSKSAYDYLNRDILFKDKSKNVEKSSFGNFNQVPQIILNYESKKEKGMENIENLGHFKEKGISKNNANAQNNISSSEKKIETNNINFGNNDDNDNAKNYNEVYKSAIVTVNDIKYNPNFKNKHLLGLKEINKFENNSDNSSNNYSNDNKAFNKKFYSNSSRIINNENIRKLKTNKLSEASSSQLEMKNFLINENNLNKYNFNQKTFENTLSNSSNFASNYPIKNLEQENSKFLRQNYILNENLPSNSNMNDNHKNYNRYLSNFVINADINENEVEIIKNKNKLKDFTAYEEFKKYLKEKTIKKSPFLNIYKHCFSKKRIKKMKNIKYLIKIQDFVSEELDIIKILKKLIEYDHFKSLFLTDTQLKLFNIMQKRILTDEILNEKASHYYHKLFFKNKMQELSNFKYLVDHLFEYDEENKFSKSILEKIKKEYEL